MAEKAYPTYSSSTFRIVRQVTLILVALMLALTGMLAWPALAERTGIFTPFETSRNSALSNQTPVTLASQIQAAATAQYSQAPQVEPSTPVRSASMTDWDGATGFVPFAPLDKGLIILSMSQGGYSHLYAYQIQGVPFTRLTCGGWDDLHPAIEPKGKRLVFSSNRDGQWDLYLMDLSTGETQRLTHTPAYDGEPGWSPDGRWIVYESYLDQAEQGNLEIFIQPVDGSQPPIQLTSDSSADFSPVWSPSGRQIAFISTRTGENEVWLADLDQVDSRFTNISHAEQVSETSPSWSADGSLLAWSARDQDGIQNLVVWDYHHPGERPRLVGSGSLSAWSPSGEALLAVILTPNRSYLTAYSLADQSLVLPNIALSGSVSGLSWQISRAPKSLPAPLVEASLITPTPQWSPVLTNPEPIPGNRLRLVELTGFESPAPVLQDAADEAFQALRQHIARESGWDFLSSLEAAYTPLSSPVGPGTQEDWLYTGRAFRFNTSPLNAGWVKVMREDYGGLTFWRIFIRTVDQTGHQGQPLKELPWNFSSRHSGDARAYEQGGLQENMVPPGYWIDFTALASDFGWERLESLASWRVAFSTIRYNEFVLRQGLDWLSAMQQIYPRQALDTPTPVPSPTFTPTITMSPTPTLTPTRTPYYTRTPRPTNTPWPTKTSPPTRTPSPTPTPAS